MDLYDKSQNLFPVNGNSSQRKTNLIATPIFYSSEAVFVDKLQITSLELC